MGRKLMGVLFLWSLPLVPLFAADMAGGRDHPSIPRVSGSEILGFAYSDYDVGTFLTETPDGKSAIAAPEGRRTRILYLAKPGDTPLMVQKNYEAALADLGDPETVYACATTECSGHLLSTTLWTRDTMIPTDGLKNPFYLIGFSHNFTQPRYRYLNVVDGSTQYHVGVFASTIAANNPNPTVQGRTVALVEVLEVADFQPTLEFVDASEMQSQIAQSGHVALYGIQFDHDKATLRPESAATTAEIAKALAADDSLALYVVGHTDDVGALAYNRDLSLRRAQTVVDALVARGIDAARLTPVGVGPVAPVASNAAEDGRALNRRVELVARSSGR